MGKALENSKRLNKSYDNWEELQKDYPKIKLVKDYRGKIIDFRIPEDYIIIFLNFSPDNKDVVFLTFIDPEYPDELVRFSL